MTTNADVCVTACADLFRGDGEILASPMGLIPSLGARLARLTFEPELLLSDGESVLLAETPALGEAAAAEGWLPFRQVFDVVASGRRHVVMGANQVDRYGNQNISAIGSHELPTKQLLGMRGAPGNSVNHRTSYWVPKHSTRVFVSEVDIVAGVGNNREGGPFHDVYRVVTNLAVLGFDAATGSMRVVSTHPGVELDQVVENTSFPLLTDDCAVTRTPTEEELRLLGTLDPQGKRSKEVPA
jgi:acyl CoA:acetate/3-ketoacid CoA transferase beta subunit